MHKIVLLEAIGAQKRHNPAGKKATDYKMCKKSEHVKGTSLYSFIRGTPTYKKGRWRYHPAGGLQQSFSSVHGLTG
jgi:hypothetical protein